MSLADALKKAGVVSEEQYNKHQDKKREAASVDEELKAFAVKTYWMTSNLGAMEQAPTQFFSQEMMQIADTLGKFAQQFKDNPQVRKSIEFHMNKIAEKQKWKLDFDYSSLIGHGLLSLGLNIKAANDAQLVWAIRATGYALCDVLAAHPRYSIRTKREVHSWIKVNGANLKLV